MNTILLSSLLFFIVSNNAYALQLLKTKADHDEVMQLPSLFEDNLVVKDDIVKQLTKSARQNDARAQFSLGNMYYRGISVKKDYKIALYWYMQVADAGYASGQYYLAMMYQRGEGTAKNRKKAKFWLEKAVQKRSAKAQFHLAKLLEEDKQDSQALRLYLASAKSGFVLAQYELARIYRTGRLVKKNDAIALEWALKAAERNYAPAQYLTGVIYRKGDDIERDNKKSIYWYKRAAQNGDSVAQYNLAILYFKGEGVVRNLKTSIKWFKKSAEQGFAPAQYSLGLRYLEGSGVGKNFLKAVDLFHKAAQQDNSNAQYSLALRYQLGQGVEKNLERALYWHEKAAKSGNIEAKYYLANHYLSTNNATAKNTVLAFSMLDDLAKKGHPLAIEKLRSLTEDEVSLITRQNSKTTSPKLTNPKTMSTATIKESKLTQVLNTDTTRQTITKDTIKKSKLRQILNADTTKRTRANNLANNLFERIISENYPNTEADAKLAPKTIRESDKILTKKTIFYLNQDSNNRQNDENLSNLAHSTRIVNANIIKQLRILAMEDNVLAQYNLALLYYTGQFVPKDKVESFYWVKRSAELGFIEAQNSVAVMYGIGDGVSKDLVKAKHWADKSATSGNLKAKIFLSKILNKTENK